MTKSVEEALVAAIVADPTDVSVREVYADWLEQAGDPRCHFVRRHAETSPLPPDHPDRRAGEAALARARVGCSADWLAILEPERAHQLADPVPSACACFREGRVDQGWTWLPVELDREPQDTECDAWHRLLELVDRAASDRRTTFSPFSELEPGDCERIVTLPPTIARLTEVTSLVLYGSHLVRIPPEIGQMSALRSFTPYTSYRLHWFPYEITRCARLTDTSVAMCSSGSSTSPRTDRSSWCAGPITRAATTTWS
jgi:uncharacterized protein (TIGR02996 family)